VLLTTVDSSILVVTKRGALAGVTGTRRRRFWASLSRPHRSVRRRQPAASVAAWSDDLDAAHPGPAALQAALTIGKARRSPDT